MLSYTLFLLLMSLGVTVVFLACLSIYFLPAAIAFVRNHPHRIAILVLNLIAGCTIVGWIAAFIWAFIDNPIPKRFSAAQELEEFAKLKEQGIITDEEFKAKKNKLLNL